MRLGYGSKENACMRSVLLLESRRGAFPSAKLVLPLCWRCCTARADRGALVRCLPACRDSVPWEDIWASSIPYQW